MQAKRNYDETRLMLSDVPSQARDFARGEGAALVQLFRGGREVGRRESRNAIVQNGMTFMARRTMSSGASPAYMRFMQLGKASTAASTTNTDILTALAAATLSGRQTVQTTSMSGRTAQYEHTWTATEFSAAGLEEAGLFNALTTASGTMLGRFVFTLVNKTASDTLKITWTVRVS